MKTREQERALAAYEKVAAMQGSSHKEDYGRLCVHLPELIHRNGLCQTVAFLEAKGADNERKPWFGQVLRDLGSITKLAPSQDQFAAAVRKAQLAQYQRYAREAMACAQWLKRYSEAILKVDASERVGE
jgi:CRISPR-associated protein Cmr5